MVHTDLDTQRVAWGVLTARPKRDWECRHSTGAANDGGRAMGMANPDSDSDAAIDHRRHCQPLSTAAFRVRALPYMPVVFSPHVLF